MQNPYARKRPRPNPPVNVSTIGETLQEQREQQHEQNNGCPAPAPAGLERARPPSRAGRTPYGESSYGAAGWRAASTVPQSSATPPVFMASTAHQPQHNNINRYSFDSPEDSSFDWDEAFKVADEAVANSQSNAASHGGAETQSSKPTSAASQGRERSSSVSNPRPPAERRTLGIYHAHCNQTSSPLVDLTQGTTQNADGTHRKPSTHFNSTNSPTKKPPLHRAAPSHNNSSSMASLRPTAWSNAQSKPKDASPQLSQQIISKQGQSKPSPAPHKHPLIGHLPVELRFSPEIVKPAKDAYRKDLIQHANLGKPLANGWTLYDHQKKAILKGLLMRRFILALDMGLGKTLIGCVWMRSFQKTLENCKAIVICPVSLKQEWTRTATEATELKVMAEETKSKSKKTTTKKKKANVGIDATEDDNTMPKVEIFSWAKVPTSVDNCSNYVVVADEAHSIQSMQAARTKDLLKLVKAQSCVGVLLLTGTPMKNGKPSNLFPLLRAVRHPFGRNQRAYETQFCAGRQKQFGRGPPVWDASGSSNLGQLRELVSSHLLHLTKDECLKSLPKSTREHEWIPVSHRQQMQYAEALKDMQRLHAMSSAMETDSHEALLGALQRLRFIGSVAKVDATVEIARQTLQDEPAVVIFTSFVQVASSIHKKLKEGGWSGELLTGETPAKKRQGMVDNFQGGLSPVFVCTFGAGGVGLTLTAARTVILLDRPWTPGDAAQAEDRIRRIGQVHPCKSIWVSAFDVDKQIDQMLESKTQTSNTVLADGREGAKTNGLPAAAPKVSIFRLISTMVPDKQHESGPPRGVSPGLSQTSINSYFEKT